MILFAHCKINLGLRILRRRADGYHDIESVMYPVPWYDAVEVVKAEKFSFQSLGNPVDGATDDNLCVRAYHLMKERFDLPPVNLFLLKNIPSGAGLGGGSSDGAFTLKLLNAFFKLQCPERQLHELAAQLGSDAPFFLESKPCFVSGRGEILQQADLNLSSFYICIVYPNVKVNTAWAYTEWSRSASAARPHTADRSSPEWALSQPPESWKDVSENDFEEVVFPAHPVLANIKQQLYDAGALYASMSGSGSSVYGLFRERPTVDFDPAYKIFSGKLALK